MTEHKTLASMTGFARAQGESGNAAFIWELRSVNGRGLDIKLRLANGLEALELPLRDIAAQQFKRGNVSGTLSIKREAGASIATDLAVLERVKALAIELAASIPGAPAPRAELLLGLPGVLRGGQVQEETEEERTALIAAVRAGFLTALAGLAESRAAEGAKLAAIAATNLHEISLLREAAALEAAKQPELHRAKLAAQLAELIGSTPNLPEERIAQEIALLTTKSDVREELDRLSAHIEAAEALLREGVAVGRKLDFLMQEFNREANTLCSKSSSVPLTNIGLALKAAIEQLREQVQNIERRGLCLVLAAPSGAGKTTLSRALLEQDDALSLSISVTTRERRPGEKEGKHYYFISQDRFDAMAEAGELLEYARVFGRSYGTPRAAVEAALSAGQDVMFDIDWQGFRQLRASLGQDVVGVFIKPPSLEVLHERLAKRGDGPEQVAARMEHAGAEISHAGEFDYIVENRDLDVALADIRAILRASRLATFRQA